MAERRGPHRSFPSLTTSSGLFLRVILAGRGSFVSADVTKFHTVLMRRKQALRDKKTVRVCSFCDIGAGSFLTGLKRGLLEIREWLIERASTPPSDLSSAPSPKVLVASRHSRVGLYQLIHARTPVQLLAMTRNDRARGPSERHLTELASSFCLTSIQRHMTIATLAPTATIFGAMTCLLISQTSRGLVPPLW
jgi:hypothetical protein